MKRITRRPEVDADLERYWNHLARHNEDAADKFLDAVEKGFRAIQLTPAIGPAAPLERCTPGRRALLASARLPQLAHLCREASTSIDVIRVLHGMMDLETKISGQL